MQFLLAIFMSVFGGWFWGDCVHKITQCCILCLHRDSYFTVTSRNRHYLSFKIAPNSSRNRSRDCYNTGQWDPNRATSPQNCSCIFLVTGDFCCLTNCSSVNSCHWNECNYVFWAISKTHNKLSKCEQGLKMSCRNCVSVTTI